MAESPPEPDLSASETPDPETPAPETPAPETPGASASADEPAGERTAGHKRGSDREFPGRFSFWTALVLAVLTLSVSGWLGYSWWHAATDPSVQRAVARHDALRAGERAVATLNTLDYRTIDKGYRRWLDVSTGPLHDQLARNPDEAKKRIREATSVTDASIVDAAVTELNDDAGTAQIIASVKVSVTPKGKEETTTRNRFQAELKRTHSGWKVEQLAPVPVGQS